MKGMNFTPARIVACAVLILFSVLTTQAQFKAGIQGTVTDSTGGLVPEAKITLTNKETGDTQEVTSSADGFYRITGLAPGKYVLTIEKAGHQKSVMENVVIDAES